MKKQKGITLIALIITIIVMLILVGVTVNVAINGGLITVTQEAKFKTEVRQIEEGLQVRKAVLLAENLGTLENITSITIDELDIDQKLKTKYAEKLIISKETDDFVLYYNEANVTNQEKIWLEELGIEKVKGEEPFINDFEISISKDPLTSSGKVEEVRITVKPQITSQWGMPEEFTEETALPIVVSEFKSQGMIDSNASITTLQQLDLELYNMLTNIESTPLYGLQKATVFYSRDKIEEDDVSVQEILTSVDASYSDITAQEFFALSVGNGDTVEEYAASKYKYTPTNYSMKIAKGTDELVDISDEVNWNGLIHSGATYNITTNGSYTIELELEGKRSRNTVEVNEIYVEKTEEEQLQIAIQNSYNNETGKVDLNTLKFYLANWTTNLNNNLLKCKKNDGETEYVVTEQGRIEKTTLTTEEVLEKLQIEQTEGKYEGEWELIGTNGENLKYVSVENVAQVDNRADVLYGSANEDRKRYINVASVLNTAVEEATGISEAKSITMQDICDILGLTNINQGEPNLYKFTYDETTETVFRTQYYEIDGQEGVWANKKDTEQRTIILIDENGSFYAVGWQDDAEGTISAILNDDNVHEFTNEQLEQLFSLNSSDSYWIPTQNVLTREDYANISYCVSCFEDGKIKAHTWATFDYSSPLSSPRGVRAVISI